MSNAGWKGEKILYIVRIGNNVEQTSALYIHTSMKVTFQKRSTQSLFRIGTEFKSFFPINEMQCAAFSFIHETSLRVTWVSTQHSTSTVPIWKTTMSSGRGNCKKCKTISCDNACLICRWTLVRKYLIVVTLVGVQCSLKHKYSRCGAFECIHSTTNVNRVSV